MTGQSSPAGPPCTRASLRADLADLGLSPGDTVLVHSSLRSLGFVIGGPVAVVQALLDATGPAGTVVVPTFTADNSDPSRWAQTRKEPVPAQWWELIRDELPAFDRARTPSHGVGAIAELLRCWPGALRSDHPQTSFAALGHNAATLTRGHRADCHLGPDSPLGRLDDLAAKVLLLGVPYARCTAFHLAQYRVTDPPRRGYECVVEVAGARSWFRYRDVLLDDSGFQQLGEAFEASTDHGVVGRRPVGQATARLFPVREAVQFAVSWLTAHRPAG